MFRVIRIVGYTLIRVDVYVSTNLRSLLFVKESLKGIESG